MSYFICFFAYFFVCLYYKLCSLWQNPILSSLPIPQGGFAPSTEEGESFGDENAFGSTNSPFPEDDGGDGSFYTDDDLEDDDYEEDDVSGSYGSAGSFEEEESGSFAEDESFVDDETEYDEEEVVSLEDNGGQSEIWN